MIAGGHDLSEPPDPPAACALAIMAKASVPGVAKTRLSPPLSPAEAAACNTAFLRDVIDNVAAAAGQAPLQGYLAYGPPGSRDFFDGLGPTLRRFEAWGGGLSETLTATLERMFALGHPAAMVMNADSPTLPTAVLVEAAQALRDRDQLVIGPSEDGGYYLLGMRSLHRPLFEGIAWSTDAVFEQTLERATSIGLPVHRLPRWYDVDDVAGLAALAEEVLDGRPRDASLAGWPAPHSATVLRALDASRLGSRGPFPLKRGP